MIQTLSDVTNQFLFILCYIKCAIRRVKHFQSLFISYQQCRFKDIDRFIMFQRSHWKYNQNTHLSLHWTDLVISYRIHIALLNSVQFCKHSLILVKIQLLNLNKFWKSEIWLKQTVELLLLLLYLSDLEHYIGYLGINVVSSGRVGREGVPATWYSERGQFLLTARCQLIGPALMC